MTERNEFIDRLQQLTNKLENATAQLNDAQLDTSISEGKWTIRQIVHHIADANLNAYTRMKLIVTEEKPILKPYNQDQWASLADGKKSRIEPSLILIKGLHERWVQFLRSLPETTWTRQGIHLERGLETLDDNLNKYVTHGETHLQQILSIREKMKF